MVVVPLFDDVLFVAVVFSAVPFVAMVSVDALFEAGSVKFVTTTTF